MCALPILTLRREKMYEFLERLIAVALPRIRDFRGISARGFDGSGNFNFGVTEQIIFPEIEYEKVDAVRGMNITITTTPKNDQQGKALLDAFNFPFRDRKSVVLGKSVSVRVDLGCRLILKKKKSKTTLKD